MPVICLREKLGLSTAEHTVDTSIIVMDVEVGERTVTIGCIADAVDEVLSIMPEDVEAAPAFGSSVDSAFIAGIAKKDETFIILLDIYRVFENDVSLTLDNHGGDGDGE